MSLYLYTRSTFIYVIRRQQYCLKPADAIRQQPRFVSITNGYCLGIRYVFFNSMVPVKFGRKNMCEHGSTRSFWGASAAGAGVACSVRVEEVFCLWWWTRGNGGKPPASHPFVSMCSSVVSHVRASGAVQSVVVYAYQRATEKQTAKENMVKSGTTWLGGYRIEVSPH